MGENKVENSGVPWESPGNRNSGSANRTPAESPGLPLGLISSPGGAAIWEGLSSTWLVLEKLQEAPSAHPYPTAAGGLSASLSGFSNPNC